MTLKDKLRPQLQFCSLLFSDYAVLVKETGKSNVSEDFENNKIEQDHGCNWI